MGMKAEKVHGIIEEGIVYIGFYLNRKKKYIKAKNGTTEHKMNERASVIKSINGKNFRVLAYFILPNTTKSCIEYLEAGMKIELEKAYTHIGNDHFVLKNNKQEMIEFAKIAILTGAKICDQMGWERDIAFFKIS